VTHVVTLFEAKIAGHRDATPALVQSGYKYDPRSGNSYNWYQQSDGSTNVRGSNLNTGSQWNTTIKPNGDQNGLDQARLRR
jgi:hypothetical protein